MIVSSLKNVFKYDVDATQTIYNPGIIKKLSRGGVNSFRTRDSDVLKLGVGGVIKAICDDDILLLEIQEVSDVDVNGYKELKVITLQIVQMGKREGNWIDNVKDAISSLSNLK